MAGPTLSLTRYAWLSVAAAVVTIALKTGAYLLTESIGLLSDALESVVNLVAAIAALFALRYAEAPPDDDHEYGHEKAEYFASGLEGGLILFAGLAIIATAVPRVLHPKPLEHLGLGLAVSTVASVVNLLVARILLRAGRRHASITLEADGHHLMTDVWTSAGVIAGVGLVGLTNVQRLDPLLAIGVALHVLSTGWGLVRRSMSGLLDASLPKEERQQIVDVLDRFKEDGATWHALRTRRAGRRVFVDVHVLVPGAWTVQKGHDLLERVEADLRAALPLVTVSTHLEPVEDEASFRDP